MKNITLLATLGAVALTATARELTPEEAIVRAFDVNRTPVAKHTPSKAMDLAFTQLSEKSMKAAYVFNSPEGGYLIVSADDVAAPILGYSERGSFNVDAMPENMKAWLQGYAAEIENASINGQKTAIQAPSTQKAARTEIKPLVETRWGQGYPYNLLCPTVNGSATYSGCVATAMAQIMKYHEWPAKATGNVNYTTATYKLNVSCDLSKLSLNWADMTNTYSSSSSTTSENAVANLMYACGAAVQMDYSPYGSGAASSMVAEAGVKNFGYDAAITFYEREWFTSQEWEDAIYEQLATVGPVYYAGYNTHAGHAFVCDGYAGGFYHFNWGWSGLSDGYFLLSALDPAAQGAGGSSSGYTMWQSAVFDMRPPVTGSTPSSLMVNTDNLTAVVEADGNIYFEGGIYNRSSRTLPAVTLGLKAVNTANNTVSNVKLFTSDNLAPRNGFDRFGVKISSLANFLGDGTFDLSLVYKTEGNKWIDIVAPVASQQTVRVKVSGSTMTVIPEEDHNVELSNLDVVSPLMEGGLLGFSLDLYQDSWDEVPFVLYPLFWNGSTYIFGDGMEVFLKRGEHRHVDYLGDMPDDVTDGTYSFVVAGSRYYSQSALEDMSEWVSVTVKPKQNAEFTMSNAKPVGPELNAAALKISADIETTVDYFTYFTGWLFDSNATTAISSSRTQPVALKAGIVQNVTLDFNFSGIDLSQDYCLVIYNSASSQQLSDIIRLKFSKDVSSDTAVAVDYEPIGDLNVDGGIATVTANTPIAKVELYDLSGRAITAESLTIIGNTATFNIDSLAKGFHLAKVVDADGNVDIFKFVVR